AAAATIQPIHPAPAVRKHPNEQRVVTALITQLSTPFDFKQLPMHDPQLATLLLFRLFSFPALSFVAIPSEKDSPEI
ncbi:hypothetical protein, partial [Mediterraneibacter sp. 210702-DFI.5.30]|uniref:hypothetical protein n=1 Tax=Mediterraneibacter sp. 210702-DFI.5.30 TaxID=2883232 RepID=UPI001D068EC3